MFSGQYFGRQSPFLDPIKIPIKLLAASSAKACKDINMEWEPMASSTHFSPQYTFHMLEWAKSSGSHVSVVLECILWAVVKCLMHPRWQLLWTPKEGAGVWSDPPVSGRWERSLATKQSRTLAQWMLSKAVTESSCQEIPQSVFFAFSSGRCSP